MVTKKAALERFINERVMGERGFGVNADGICVYKHSNNGGCEIGQYLPEALADCVLNTGYEELSTNPLVCSVLEETFEDYKSAFWADLQQAHDGLSRASRMAAVCGQDSRDVQALYREFARHMKSLAYAA